ncbi:hypothetical protein B0I26_10581 [Anoxybacillus vitaminiphilus]|uniref:Yip1-like protein n=1 Tax=Paranoxybacillus vitaminiphilus TaxID=581036 RepID=A0A327YNW7_9BACL|nr:hypothetical protein [Anoxybacillus vitaminiphilus]RAK19899.1 hypothetical protein B0I26_10581 [Anoxybacillus vitaminiphilus]
MIFRIQLWRGIFQPNFKFYQLRQAEKVNGLLWRLMILSIVSGLLSGLSVYAGLDTEMFTRLVEKKSMEAIEAMKLLFGVGSVLNGIISPIIIMYLSSLLIWTVLEDMKFYKIAAIQLYVVFIGVLEKTLEMVFRLMTGANSFSSPFGFGILAQLITDQPLLIHFMNEITIFGILGVIIQIIALKICSSFSLGKISILVIGIYLIFNLISSLLSLMDIEQIFKVI